MDDAESYWSPLIKLVAQIRCWVRTAWRDGVLTEEGEWGKMLIMPVKGYLEAGGGPIPLRDVEWVEVSTMRVKGGIAGRPLEIIDIKDEILKALRETQLDWELLNTTWSLSRFFENEPIQLIRFRNPFVSMRSRN